MHSELYQFWMMVIFKHALHPPARFLTESNTKSKNMKIKIAITNKPNQIRDCMRPEVALGPISFELRAQSHLSPGPNLIWLGPGPNLI